MQIFCGIPVVAFFNVGTEHSLSLFLGYFIMQKLSLFLLGCLVSSRDVSEALVEAFWNLR